MMQKLSASFDQGSIKVGVKDLPLDNEPPEDSIKSEDEDAKRQFIEMIVRQNLDSRIEEINAKVEELVSSVLDNKDDEKIIELQKTIDIHKQELVDIKMQMIKAQSKLNIFSMMQRTEREARRRAMDNPEYRAFAQMMKNHIQQDHIIDLIKENYKATGLDAHNVGKKIHSLLARLSKQAKQSELDA